MKIFSISNQKGGVGKSVISYHLASYLGSSETVTFHKMETVKGKKTRKIALQRTLLNKKVLFLDFDPQGNGSSMFGNSVEGINTYNLLTEDRYFFPNEEGVTVIKAHESLKDVHLLNANDATKKLISNLDNICEYFDYVVIDTPPTENLIVRSVFVVTDYLIAPIVPVKFSIDGLGSMLKLIIGMQQHFNKGMKFLGMLPSKVAGKVDKVNDDNPDVVKRLRMQQSNLKTLLQSPYGKFLLMDVETVNGVQKSNLIGISERQVIEVAISSGEPVWKQKGAEALASTQEFFAVFDAIEKQIGGF